MIEIASHMTEIMSRKHSKNATGYERIVSGSPTALFDYTSPLPSSPSMVTETDDVVTHTSHQQHPINHNLLFNNESSLSQSVSAVKPQHGHMPIRPRRTGQCQTQLQNQSVQQHVTVHPLHSSVIRPPPNITIAATASRETPYTINNTVKNIQQRTWSKVKQVRTSYGIVISSNILCAAPFVASLN